MKTADLQAFQLTKINCNFSGQKTNHNHQTSIRIRHSSTTFQNIRTTHLMYGASSEQQLPLKQTECLKSVNKLFGSESLVILPSAAGYPSASGNMWFTFRFGNLYCMHILMPEGYFAFQTFRVLPFLLLEITGITRSLRDI